MTLPHAISPQTDLTAEKGRWVMWVDGVGTFLLCDGGPVTIGGLSGQADARVVANLARMHAVIRRSGEGYVLEASEPALVAADAAQRGSGSGCVVREKTSLASGDEIVLYREHSPGVRFRFRRPNVLTATATLELESDHRTDPRFDRIVLLADSCLMGPGGDTHIRCREWPGALLIFRRSGRIWCRSTEPAIRLTGSMDGTRVPSESDALPLEAGVHVTAPGISFRFARFENKTA